MRVGLEELVAGEAEPASMDAVMASAVSSKRPVMIRFGIVRLANNAITSFSR
jgi:hypothetical protein